MNGQNIKLNRRTILLGLSCVALSTIIGYRELKSLFGKKKYAGDIIGANFNRGHLLKDPKFPQPSIEKSIKTLIIGAGVSGLSSAYQLKKHNEDFLLIDLDLKVGGNSSFGANQNSQYPQGAHYLPLPNRDLFELKDFLRDINVITNDDLSNPLYNQEYLCHELEERLFIHGHWQEGIVPSKGLDQSEIAKIEAFFNKMSFYKALKGSDGKKAFCIPLRKSSNDPEILKLDDISMLDYLKQEGLSCEPLNWYVNYCCRDDYGSQMQEVSAWAGIHYFAAREESDILTWPEGNGFLVKKFYEKLKDDIKLNQMLFKVENVDEKILAHVYDFKQRKSICYSVEHIIYAGPQFSARNIFENPEIKSYLKEIKKNYVPWMVANIEINGYEYWGEMDLAWDSVNYHGKSLGHVNANHQNISLSQKNLSLSQYWDLAFEYGNKARLKALSSTHQEWCDKVVNELKLIYPNIEKYIQKIDISLWGHAMCTPTPGFRKSINKDFDHLNIYFAHTDKNHISIFEEAFYQGLEAAQKVIKHVG